MFYRLSISLLMAVFLSTAIDVGAAWADKTVKNAKQLEQAKKEARIATNQWDKETKAWKSKFKDAKGEQMLLMVVATANLHDAKRSRVMMEEAVKSCEKAHPAMKDDLRGSFTNFRKEADKALSLAGKSRDYLVDRQTVAAKNDVHKYLKLFENAARKRDALIDTIPVSDEKDCKNLIKSLDKNAKKLPKTMKKVFVTSENQMAALLEEEAKGTPPAKAKNN